MIPIATVSAAALAMAYVDAKLYLARDLRTIAAGITAPKQAEKIINAMTPHVNAYDFFFDSPYVKFRDGDMALWFEGKTWTYAQLKAEILKISRYMVENGFKSRDVIAVLFDNSPESIFASFAAMKIGAIPALVNATLRGEPLAHSLAIVKPVCVITQYNLAEEVHQVHGAIPEPRPMVVVYDCGSFAPKAVPNARVVKQATLASGQGFDFPKAKLDYKDCAFMIYTSGTTGKPKAIACPAQLCILISLNTPRSVVTNKDRFHSCLPLYHGSGFAIAMLHILGQGGTFVCSRRFSTRTFWSEVKMSGTTVIMYVGEILRYLVNAPPHPDERNHQVEAIEGVGLNSELVWKKFRERFSSKTKGPIIVREFMTQTESPGGLTFNVNRNDEGVGACGHQGWLLSKLNKNSYIVKYDHEKEMPYRNAQGRCVRAAIGEPGEFINRIDANTVFRPYYGNRKATEEKWLFDVFEKGDQFHRFGDLMTIDKDGYMRFVDRIGDTYRTKGENVSTLEVAEQISAYPGILDVTVFGIPLGTKLGLEYDGQVGVAAVQLDTGRAPDLKGLASFLSKRGLPQHAHPRFLRVVRTVATTATFKHQKQTLRAEGVDPTVISDQMYVLFSDGKNSRYVPFGPDEYSELKGGRLRL